MDFCYLLQDPMRRQQPGDQAWATTLVMVDVAAQNPLCAALSTKSDENAYLSAMCAAFVKRMAYVKPVLKVDPETAFKLLADTIAKEQAQMEFSSRLKQHQDAAVRASVQLGEHETQWKVRFDACVSSWEHVSGCLKGTT